jgi:hypothetical protein
VEDPNPQYIEKRYSRNEPFAIFLAANEIIHFQRDEYQLADRANGSKEPLALHYREDVFALLVEISSDDVLNAKAFLI